MRILAIGREKLADEPEREPVNLLCEPEEHLRDKGAEMSEMSGKERIDPLPPPGRGEVEAARSRE